MGTILRVTELEVLSHPDAVVRAFGEDVRVAVDARTVAVEVEGPDNHRIDWSGDLGLAPDIGPNPQDDARLLTRYAPGAHTVTAAGLAGGRSVTLRVWRSETEVVNGPEFVITGEPTMPVVTARTRISGSVTAAFNEWRCRVFFLGDLVFCPNIPHFDMFNDDLEVTQEGGAEFTPSFETVRGTSVSFEISFTVEGQASGDSAGARILGTNPKRSEIQAALPHNTLRQIACRESGQRQFDAPADGGVSECPLFSSDGRGRVGIMQVSDPSPDHIWNWRRNVEKGIELFNERLAAAGEYPSRVQRSAGFTTLVAQFNRRRQQQGLDPVQVVLRDFTSGNFDDELGELELDAIRGYNGWEGSDRFGFELHEFRIAVDIVDGIEVLRVTNINQQTMIGEAAWEQVPVEDRPQNIGQPDYVNNVLAFGSDCLFVPNPRQIDHIFLMLDDFSKPLDWNEHIIGLHHDAKKINIQIEGRFLNLSSLTVQLTTRVPNRAPGASSVSPVQFNIPKTTVVGGQSRTVYRRTVTFADFARPASPIREVATIVRPGGTSDEFFRDALGWAPRGIGTLPGAVGNVTGNEGAEVPDALQILRSGGVEVLEARLIGIPADVTVLASTCVRLVRSPATIVYVSAHGLYDKNCIALDDTPAEAHDNHYSCWSDATALGEWNTATPQMALGERGEPEAIIFAGCSILTVETKGQLRGPGLTWAKLLRTKDSPLKAILGYRKGWFDGRMTGGGPSDSGGANGIAQLFAKLVADKWPDIDYVKEWLTLNRPLSALMAVGINKDGYWYMRLARGLAGIGGQWEFVNEKLR